MKQSNKMLLISAGAMLAASLGVAQANDAINMVTTAKKLPSYHAIAVHGHYNLTLSGNKQPSVIVSANDKVIKNMRISVDDGKLKVGPKPDFVFEGNNSFDVIAHAKSINRMELGGKGTFRASNLDADQFTLSAGGKTIGFLKGKIDNLTATLGGETILHINDSDGKDINLRTGGKSIIYLSGKADTLTVTSGGDTKIYAKNLEVNTFNIRGAGRVQATINAKKNINVTLFGKGIINYYGHPTIKQETFGKVQLNKISD